ncbi:MAG: amino acid permease, partial [Planctomycetota bacterium]
SRGGASAATKLKRGLGLADVFAIATGAMLSSGFFLLPGIAAGMTGASVVLAYLASSLLIIPAMLSVAELSTAMPKSGGAYFFIDRALGPLTGTVGGVGTWFTLILKSAFAALGIGIYVAALIPGAPVVAIAIGATAVFAAINYVGAKETSGMQQVLVAVLLLVLGGFIVHGLWDGFTGRLTGGSDTQLPFLSGGIDGFLATVGMVFVSYLGLTKVASVAGEVKRPERNIPLGMFLALGVVTAIYVLGVWVVLKTLPPGELVTSAAPVTDTASSFVRWIPKGVATLLLAVAALAAFASTTNAGIMSASRYLLAMAQDKLLPAGMAEIGSRHTPGRAILVTALVTAGMLVAFDVAAVAKLAGAFQLIIFMMLHVAVLVMRESRIDGYEPGFRSPLYPWVQVFGILSPMFLIAEMGWTPVLFCLCVAIASVVWFLQYARPKVQRRGALYHVFALLGRNTCNGIEQELEELVAEMGVRPEDSYGEVVARSPVVDAKAGVGLIEALGGAAALFAQRVPLDAATVHAGLTDRVDDRLVTIVPGVVIPHARFAELDQPELVLIRSREGMPYPGGSQDTPALEAVLCLLSPEADVTLHLRLLAQIARHVAEPGFLERWRNADCPTALHRELLHDDRHIAVDLVPGSRAADLLAARSVAELELPSGTLLATVRREGEVTIPRGSTRLAMGDRLMFIGGLVGIEELRHRYDEGPET